MKHRGLNEEDCLGTLLGIRSGETTAVKIPVHACIRPPEQLCLECKPCF